MSIKTATDTSSSGRRYITINTHQHFKGREQKYTEMVIHDVTETKCMAKQGTAHAE